MPPTWRWRGLWLNRRGALYSSGLLDSVPEPELDRAGAIISLSKADADTVEGVAAAAQSRLVALASVQDFTNPSGGRVDLEPLVWRLLVPFDVQTATSSVNGPPVGLGASQLTPLGLFLHELATSSAKYGALRDGKGSP